MKTCKSLRIAAVALALVAGVGSGYAKKATPADDAKFIDNLMSKMTLDEKIGQLNLLPGNDVVSGELPGARLEPLIKEGKLGAFLNVQGIDNISRLQHLAVEHSRLGIPLLAGADVIHGYQTVFPIPLALSCSWDSDAVERMARISAKEATADGINWNYSPMVDICRDPRWGRIAEGSGEDPYLGCILAAAYVRGYQGDNLKADSTVMACVKHYALYGAAEGGRDYNTVDMSRERMFNYYMPPYRAAVDAGVESLMTSFNLVNGQHATAAHWLIEDILRRDWGFKGMIVTDYGSISELTPMGVAEESEAAANTLKAGTDMDMCTSRFLKDLKGALERGLITEEMIDKACRRVLEAKQKLGLFENPYLYGSPERVAKDDYTPANRAAARDIAAETFVLLRNEGSLLPLAKKGKIALIGPLADAGNQMCGTWAPNCRPDTHQSLLSALREEVGDRAEVIYAQGSNIYYDEKMQENATRWNPIYHRGDNETLRTEALAAAEKADVIVAAVGETMSMSGESASRADITIPDAQRDLLKDLAATGKPVVLVLFTGRPLVLDWESKNIPAILNVWFGGSEAGKAICDVIFGDKVPSAKLTTTFPQMIGQIPLYYNHLPPSHPDTDPEHFNIYRSNYIDVSNDPLYPFGYGLSYTTFAYGKPSLSSNELTMDGKITLSVDVTNTGNYDGTEIVQLYLRDPVARIARPVKELKGFRRLDLKKGETATVTFDITPDMLKYYDADLKYVCDPGAFEAMVGPNSAAVQTLPFTLR